MSRRTVGTQRDLGARIAKGRAEANLTQADLARVIGIDRTAVAKIEKGVRRVSATELVAIAAVLDRPVDWLVSESPPAVVSRRDDKRVGGRSRSLDSLVERIGRDVEYLLEQGVLPQREPIAFKLPSDFDSCESMAAKVRELMDAPDGPLVDLQRRVETMGLLGFSLDLTPEGGDAAFISLGGWGVAVVNGALDSGRRRFSLAHELGHHLIGDAYAPEIDPMAGDDVEKLLNAFVAYLLMPRHDVTKVWRSFEGGDRRLGCVAIATRFRVSWTSACSHLVSLDLIDRSEFQQFVENPPRRGDLIELGEQWVPELEPPSVPPDYGRCVLGAYRSGKMTAARAVELLWGTVNEDELPEPAEVPLEAFRREFEPLG